MVQKMKKKKKKKTTGLFVLWFHTSTDINITA